jgi:hypothetical protein
MAHADRAPVGELEVGVGELGSTGDDEEIAWWVDWPIGHWAGPPNGAFGQNTIQKKITFLVFYLNKLPAPSVYS